MNSDRRRNWPAWVALIVSFGSLIWSGYIHYQLLPIQQSNVVLLESDIQITPDDNICLHDGECGTGDTIKPIITNSGRAEARDISFKVYDAIFGGSELLQPFSDYLVSSLQPGATAKFGIFGIPYNPKGFTDLRPFKGKQQVVLVFNLQYTDSIDSSIQNRIFLYQYTLGTTGVGSLIGADYKIVYPRLLSGAEKFEDGALINFLKKNAPN